MILSGLICYLENSVHFYSDNYHRHWYMESREEDSSFDFERNLVISSCKAGGMLLLCVMDVPIYSIGVTLLLSS
jgi:hypothetical protein